jgi:hypothetical protein
MKGNKNFKKIVNPQVFRGSETIIVNKIIAIAGGILLY